MAAHRKVSSLNSAPPPIQSTAVGISCRRELGTMIMQTDVN